MPLGSLEHGQTGLTIPVAGGCGPGFHRGPYGGCVATVTTGAATGAAL